MSILAAGESPVTFLAEHDAIISGTLPSFPHKDFLEQPPQDTNQSNIGATILRFILWTHTYGDGQEIFPYLADSKVTVIAREAKDSSRHFYSEEQARCYTEEYALAASALSFATGATINQATHSKLREKGYIPYYTGEKLAPNDAETVLRTADLTHLHLLRGMHDKPKHIVDLDIDPSSHNRWLELEHEYEDLSERLLYQLSTERFEWTDACKTLGSVLRADLAVIEFRERVTRTQLQALVDAYPGEIIAVVYGRSHHPLLREYEHTSGHGVAFQRIIARGLSCLSPQELYKERLDERVTMAMRVGANYQKDIERALLCRLDDGYRYQTALTMATEDQLDELILQMQELYAASIDILNPSSYRDLNTRGDRKRQIVNGFVGSIQSRAQE